MEIKCEYMLTIFFNNNLVGLGVCGVMSYVGAEGEGEGEG